MIIYISGKYTVGNVDENILAARNVAIKMWEYGLTAICPHLNTANFEKDCKATYEDYIRGDVEILQRCDAIFMLKGWEESKGAKIELSAAKKSGLHIFIEGEDSLEEIAAISQRRGKHHPHGVKYDTEKPMWELIDLGSIGQLVDVLTYGAKKYSPNNWKKLDRLEDRYFAALMRHLAAHRAGESNDPESGLPHTSHALACMYFINTYNYEKNSNKETETGLAIT